MVDEMLGMLETNEDKKTVKETPKRKAPVRRKASPAKSELEAAMALIKELSEKVAALEGKEEEPEVAKETIDIMKPYATIRSLNGVTYEQFGKKYNGKKQLIED